MFSLRVNSLFFQNQTFRRCAIRVEERKNDDFLRANFLFFSQQPSCHWAMRLWRRKKGNFLRAMMLFFQKETFRSWAMRLWETKYANFSQANSLFFVSNLFCWANKPKLRSKDACRFGEMSVGCSLVLFRLREKGKHTVTTCLHREGIKVERTKTIAG